MHPFPRCRRTSFVHSFVRSFVRSCNVLKREGRRKWFARAQRSGRRRHRHRCQCPRLLWRDFYIFSFSSHARPTLTLVRSFLLLLLSFSFVSFVVVTFADEKRSKKKRKKETTDRPTEGQWSVSIRDRWTDPKRCTTTNE